MPPIPKPHCVRAWLFRHDGERYIRIKARIGGEEMPLIVTTTGEGEQNALTDGGGGSGDEGIGAGGATMADSDGGGQAACEEPGAPQGARTTLPGAVNTAHNFRHSRTVIRHLDIEEELSLVV